MQPYKYNNKELDKELGLEIYDYVARQRGNDIPVFTSIDPLAEKYYEWSPYAYVYNNPMKYIDPDGRQGVLPMPGILPLPVPTSTKAPTASDYKNAGREIRRGANQIGFVAKAMAIILVADTQNKADQFYKDITNPGWRNQEKQDRKAKEKLDRAQANVAEAIKNNMPDGSGDGNGGDPGNLGKGVIIGGLAGALIENFSEPIKNGVESRVERDNNPIGSDKSQPIVKPIDDRNWLRKFYDYVTNNE